MENTHIQDNELRQRILFASLTNEFAEITIMPTEKCNFRCVYCYEDFEIGNMKQQVVNSVKKLIEKKLEDVKYLNINWFGGEPLLAKKIIYDINEFAKIKCEEKNVNFTSSITTNGALLDAESFLKLNSAGIMHYQISLDGDENMHDTTRIDIKGNGTFNKIWNNLLIANQLFLDGKLPNTNIMLRLHLHQENLISIANLCDLIDANLSKKIFRIFLKEIGNYGKKAENLQYLSEHTNFIELKNKLQKKVDTFSHSELIPNSDITPLPSICYASKANAYVIRANGKLAKCTVALNSDANDIGEIDREGNLRIDSDKAVKWLHGLSTMSKKDIACPLNGVLK